MDREEFERIKKEEKEHLRQIRDLKSQLRRAETLGRSRKALGDMNSALDMSELDEQLDALQRKAIETEARLDIAMESAGEGPSDVPELSPEEERDVKASALIEQLRAELKEGSGAEAPREPSPEKERRPVGEEEAEEASVQKTIGRSQGDAEQEESVPEKTIGRAGGRRRSQDSDR